MKNVKISVFKDLFKSKDVPYIITLENSLSRIKKGKSKTLIDKIRSVRDKDEKSNLKIKLPCIIFTGEFTQRNKKSLVKHSGLMVLDFDNYISNEELIENKKIISKNKHVVSCFISPSGNGLKVLIKIPEVDSKTYYEIFKEFEKEFDYKNLDNSTNDISRVCFESYDPYIYINYDAEIYDPILEDIGFEASEKQPILPISDQDVLIKKISNFKWTKSFVKGERNSFIFDLCSAFCEYGVDKLKAENYIFLNYNTSDFSIKELKNSLNSAYRSRSFGIKYFEDYNKIKNIKNDIKRGRKEVKIKHSISDDVYNELKQEAELNNFWEVSDKGKITITPIDFKFFLENNGFKKYFSEGSENPIIVRVISNKVKITSNNKIKDFVLDYLYNLGEFDVWNHCANNEKIFSDNFLMMIESIELLMINDLKDKSFLYFNNGVVEVTKSKIELLEYIDINGYVWDSEIIKRDFKLSENVDNDYKKFVENISKENKDSFETTIGYLLSTYKNRSNNKSVILNDEIISENPEGGTGKGLFVQGLKQIRQTSIIDGKMFDSKKSFPYQTVSLDTKLLVFDDVKKNFSFENIFSLVTEGMTIERKNKDAIKLDVENSPKIIISTNYTIKGDGNSHERRRHELEVSQHYNNKNTPEGEFKRQLFSDWDSEEFLRFDNYMIRCIQKYLKNGIVEIKSENIIIKKFISSTSLDFYNWMESKPIKINERIVKKEAFDLFISDFEDYKKWLNRKTFNIWIKKYASYKGLDFEDGNTNGKRWFILIDKNKEILKIDDNNEDFPF